MNPSRSPSRTAVVAIPLGSEPALLCILDDREENREAPDFKTAWQGYLRLFLEAGTDVIPLLRRAASRGIRLQYVDKLLLAFGLEDHRTLVALGLHLSRHGVDQI